MTTKRHQEIMENSNKWKTYIQTSDSACTRCCARAVAQKLLENSDIINGFIKADIVSRLLLMSDVINNSANTGLSPNGQFKIIDFGFSRNFTL